MAYIITNSSGNRCGVTEDRYHELKDKEGYTAEIVDETDSTDYTISELREMNSGMSDDQWQEFTKNDTRKTIDSI